MGWMYICIVTVKKQDNFFSSLISSFKQIFQLSKCILLDTCPTHVPSTHFLELIHALTWPFFRNHKKAAFSPLCKLETFSSVYTCMYMMLLIWHVSSSEINLSIPGLARLCLAAFPTLVQNCLIHFSLSCGPQAWDSSMSYCSLTRIACLFDG